MLSLIPNINLSSPEKTNEISPNHSFYGYEITIESQLEQFYKSTFLNKLFLVNEMVVTFNWLAENYFIEPATANEHPDGIKIIYIVSTHELEDDSSRIAKLALHEILEVLFKRKDIKQNNHCYDKSCIMSPPSVDNSIFKEKSFYETLRNELDGVKGFCDDHQNKIDEIIRRT